jgi:hypothetical protein
MAGLSDGDRDVLREIERRLRSSDPDLAERLEGSQWPRRRWRRQVGSGCWWELTALAAASLIAAASMLLAFAL